MSQQTHNDNLSFLKANHQLNNDMWREIFTFLDIASLGTLLLTSMNNLPFSRSILMEDIFWKQAAITKLNKLALLVSEPFYGHETDYPTSYSYHPVYGKYFGITVEEKTNGPNVELFIREQFREKLCELFHAINDRVMNERMDYMDMKNNIQIINMISPYNESSLFISKEELKNFKVDLSLLKILKGISQNWKYNCAMLGEPGSGRASMIFTLGYKEFPEYIPGVYGNFELDHNFENNSIRFELWNLGCHQGYERLRPTGYSISQLTCVCFSVCSRYSLARAISYFIPEIRQHRGFDIPIILIGCKIDQRSEKFSKETLKYPCKPISFEEGEEIARITGCISYIETSSLKGIGLEDFLPVCANSLVAWYSFNKSKTKKNCLTQ